MNKTTLALAALGALCSTLAACNGHPSPSALTVVIPDASVDTATAADPSNAEPPQSVTATVAAPADAGVHADAATREGGGAVVAPSTAVF